tara:strand:+ start:436 stop:864 length:429 start_codon:yes stop_codon:yes gene_type:complete
MLKNDYLATHTDYFIFSNKKKYLRRSKNYDNLNSLIKSCDIGLSTVIIKKKILTKNKFPNIKTKEDYVLWLRLLKKRISFKCFNKTLTIWNETKNSLSSNILQKIGDGYLVYNKYMKFNPIKSFFCLSRLSLNFFIKKYFNY